MRMLRISRGKKFQVNIDDTFSGDTLKIDCYQWNKKPLTKKEYLELETVQDILKSDKPLYLLSQE